MGDDVWRNGDRFTVKITEPVGEVGSVDPAMPEVSFIPRPGWLRPSVGGYWYGPVVSDWFDTEVGW